MKNIPIIITNLMKLGGLVAGLFAPHGAFTSQPEAVILAFSGFLMAGAQVSEQMIVGIVQRFLGITPEKPNPTSDVKPG